MSAPFRNQKPIRKLEAQETLAKLIADHEHALRASAAGLAALIRQRLEADDQPRSMRLSNSRTGPIAVHVANGRVYVDPETELILNAQLVGLLLGLKLELGNTLSVGRPTGGEHA